jgi:hypothetical protein
MDDLQSLIGDLAYASGAGGAHIATSVTRSSQLQSQTEVRMRLPGPALQSVLARVTGRAHTTLGDQVNAEAVLDRAASLAADEGQGLVMGRRR